MFKSENLLKQNGVWFSLIWISTYKYSQILLHCKQWKSDIELSIKNKYLLLHPHFFVWKVGVSFCQNLLAIQKRKKEKTKAFEINPLKTSFSFPYIWGTCIKQGFKTGETFSDIQVKRWLFNRNIKTQGKIKKM